MIQGLDFELIVAGGAVVFNITVPRDGVESYLGRMQPCSAYSRSSLHFVEE